ncbi:MAG: YhgE/Pip family protein, partial [Eggerthella lenta]
MGNVIRIVRSDFKRLFANAMSVIIVIGLVVMPSIFAWYNVIACWNVFDNTGNLTVAVANVDDGYESDLVPLRVNIGERVVSALRANDQIDWTFTTEEDAVDGARSGRYYAAVVIPAGFSKDMLTFYSEDVQHARIVYYANEKKSAIAPKITDQGADSVSYQVNEVFAQTLSEVALGIAESMSAYADEADVGGRIAGVSGKVRDMGAQAERMASVLELYSSLAGAAQTLASDSGKLVVAAQNGVDGLDAASSQGSTSASDLVAAVKGSVDDLAGALDGAAARFDEVSASAGALFDAASTGAAQGAAGLRGQAEAVDAQIARYRSAIEQLEELRGSLPSDAQQALDAVIARMSAVVSLMEGMRDNLGAAAERLEAGNADVQAQRAEVERLAAEARQASDDLAASFDGGLKPGLQQL